MVLKSAIIHRINKARYQSSSLNLRKQELNITNESLIRLIDEVRGLYERTGKARGVFEDNNDSYPFQRMVERFLDKKVDFVQFSSGAMMHFKETADDVNLATGGYVLFVLYEEKPNLFLMVVMLNDITGTAIDKESLEVKEIMHLETKHLHLAARLNITFWKGEEQKQYLSFIKGRGAGDISRYFLDFIGCKNYSNSQQQTRILRDAIDNYCKTHEISQDKKQEIRKKIYDHCEEKRKERKPVTLETISRLVDDENPEAFLIYANSEEVGLSDTFDPDQRVMKSFQLFTLQRQGVKLLFNRDLLGTEVILEDDRLILTEIPQEWIEQLRD
ncbi:MAG: nucleoid-associated protein [Magnetococcales bacterium]|nr:nucleoid-associated protein [Magnetococcales bacterium]